MVDKIEKQIKQKRHKIYVAKHKPMATVEGGAKSTKWKELCIAMLFLRTLEMSSWGFIYRVKNLAAQKKKKINGQDNLLDSQENLVAKDPRSK